VASPNAGRLVSTYERMHATALSGRQGAASGVSRDIVARKLSVVAALPPSGRGTCRRITGVRPIDLIRI
jgi:hypothetical protein